MSKNINLFWWYWLVCVTAGVIVFGLALIFIPNVMQAFFNWLLFSVSKTNTSFNDPTIKYISFVYGVLGAVMVGWSVALLVILLGSFRRGEREAWYALTASMVIWFVLDSGMSIITGFVENALFNVVFFVLFIVPLGATYRQFQRDVSPLKI